MKTRKKQRQVVLTQNVTENDARDYNQNEAEDLLLHTVQDHPCVPYPGIQEDPGHDHSVFDGNHQSLFFFIFFYSRKEIVY